MIMNGQADGRRMCAIVVDKEVEILRGQFLHRCPELSLCCDVDFHAVDVRGDDFFKLIGELGIVNYTVAALGDDELNQQVSFDLNRRYAQMSIDESLTKIAVVTTGTSFECASGKNVSFFGAREEIYSESCLIRQELDRTAMAVNFIYMNNSEKTNSNAAEQWRKLDWFSQESNRASATFIPAMLKLAGSTENAAVEREVLTDDKELADKLARTEHLRWMAFHVEMGYRPLSIDEMKSRFEKYEADESRLKLCRKDDKQKLHLCLVPWERLREISDAYNTLIAKTNAEESPRDFGKDDYNIIKNIPKFLKAKKSI